MRQANAHRWPAVLIVAVSASLLPRAQAEEPARALVRQGNEQYAAGQYAEALQSYRKAAELNPAVQTPELLHDQAAAHFKLGQMQDALDLWTRIKEAADPAFEARTRYNLANCAYAEALAARGGESAGARAATDRSANPAGVNAGADAGKALAKLAEAVDGYREALSLDPKLTDARANLELAQRLRRQIEAERQNQQKQAGEKGKDANDKQHSESQSKPASQPSSQKKPEKDQSKPPQTQPADQKPKKQDESSQEQKRQQQEQSKENDQGQENQQPSADEQAEQQERERQKQKAEQQKQAAEQKDTAQEPNESTPSGSQEPNATTEQQKAEKPRAAETQPGETGAERMQSAVPLQMTQAEAERLLQKIRDLEKKRREALLRQRVARQKPVERDW